MKETANRLDSCGKRTGPPVRVRTKALSPIAIFDEDGSRNPQVEREHVIEEQERVADTLEIDGSDAVCGTVQNRTEATLCTAGSGGGGMR